MRISGAQKSPVAQTGLLAEGKTWPARLQCAKSLDV
jgi:hypothetical protein